MEELIKQGTKDRLRAVLLTAAAAALGFLPMAISTNAGAEVQRPLATVVIGGLVTATLLTMIVLPVLYAIFNRPYERKRKRLKFFTKKALTLLILISSLSAFSQEKSEKNLNDLIPIALKNNASLKAYQLKVAASDALINSALLFDKTHVYYEFNENNLAPNNLPLKVFGIQQDVRFPTAYISEKKVYKARFNMETSAYEIQKKGLERKLTESYYQYQISRKKQLLFKKIDSLYQNFTQTAARRFELGETNYLEKITAASKQQQIHLKYTQANKDVSLAYKDLMQIIQSEDSIQIADESIMKISLNSLNINNSSEIKYHQNRISLFEAQRNFESQQMLPDISLTYFQGTNSLLNGNLTGYQVGLKIPILFGGKSAKIKSAKIAKEVAVSESQEYSIQLNTKYNSLKLKLKELEETVSYYEKNGKLLSEEILKTANGSFKNGEINFYQYIQSLESVYEIQLDYLDKLNQYNQTVIAINYLTL